MCTHSVGREFRKGTEKVACLCFMMSGASVGKIYKARDDSKGGGREHLSSQGSTSDKMAYSPTRQSGLLRLMTGTPLCGLSTWLLPAQWLRPEREQTDGVFQEGEHCNTPFYGPAREVRECHFYHAVGWRAQIPTEIQGKGTSILTTWWEVMIGELKNLWVFWRLDFWWEYSGEQLSLLPPRYALANVVMQEMEEGSYGVSLVRGEVLRMTPKFLTWESGWRVVFFVKTENNEMGLEGKIIYPALICTKCEMLVRSPSGNIE